jgi:hypothetical protein
MLSTLGLIDKSVTWTDFDDFDDIATNRTGKIEEIGGVKSYVATPAGEYPKEKAILFLPDAFGLELINNQVRSFINLVTEEKLVC